MASMKGAGFTAPIPARAAVDDRLTSALMWRLLTLYAWHDRRSLSRSPEGAGCTVSNKALQARLGCDYATLNRLRSKLETLGYIQVKKHESGRRTNHVRVIPDHLADPEKWPHDPSYIGRDCQKAWHKKHVESVIKTERQPEPKHDDFAIKSREKHGEIAIMPDEKHDEQISETRRNPPKTDPQYIPRRGSRYSSEEDKRYSAEAGRAKRARKPKRSIRLPDDFEPEVIGETAKTVSAWPDGKLVSEFKKFREYYRSTGDRCEDWQARWRYWVERAESHPSRGKGSGWTWANGSSDRNHDEIFDDDVPF